MLDVLEVYSFDSEGRRIVRVDNGKGRVTKDKVKGLLELEMCLLMQDNVRMRPDMDRFEKAEALARLNKKYNYLSKFISIKDLKKANGG
jgi:hypothetical protein